MHTPLPTKSAVYSANALPDEAQPSQTIHQLVVL